MLTIAKREQPVDEYCYVTEHMPLFEYKFKDITGFGFGEDFEKLYMEGSLNFGEECTLTLKSGTITLKLPSSLDNKLKENIVTRFEKFVGPHDEWRRGAIGTIKDMSYF